LAKYDSLNPVNVPEIIKLDNNQTLDTRILGKDIFTNYMELKGKTFIIPPKMMMIIRGVSHGMSMKEIANKMNISVRTVEKRIEQFNKKTGVFSTNEVIAAYWQKNKCDYNV
jgi:DNA-binding NarL/FixJ family response regulator